MAKKDEPEEIDYTRFSNVPLGLGLDVLPVEEEDKPYDMDMQVPSVRGNFFTPNQVVHLASTGLIEGQIAEALGMSQNTFRKRKVDFPAVQAAITVGSAMGVRDVVNALYKNAMSGNLGAQIFYLKNRAGWRDHVEMTADISHRYLIEATPEEATSQSWAEKYKPKTLPAP